MDLIRIGQAPHRNSLLLVGSGRLATHFSKYFENENIEFTSWSRSSSKQTLREAARARTHVLLAISDSALPGVIGDDLADFNGRIVHFSGAYHHERTACAHSPMSFGPTLYDADTYRSLHFVITGAEQLEDLLPGLKNSFSVLPKELKPLYHALCVMGGNFPILLWHKMESEFARFGIPQEAARAYVRRISDNYLEAGAAALTGPLVRGDQTTIDKNLAALDGDPWHNVYKSFVEAYK